MHTSDGADIVELGRALMVTLTLLLHWQPFPSVMVTEILAEEPEPAVQMICLVLLPDVIVPPVIAQLYVALPYAVGTDAVLPVDVAHTAEGAVIVQTGSALMVTTLLLLHRQPLPSVMVTEILAEEPKPAVQVICVVLLPAVIVPPVIDQL